jgi:hypothetical protein
VKEFREGEGERCYLTDTDLDPYDTELNYLHHVHQLAGNISEPASAEFMKRRRTEMYNQYHHDYQQRIKAKEI